MRASFGPEVVDLGKRFGEQLGLVRCGVVADVLSEVALLSWQVGVVERLVDPVPKKPFDYRSASISSEPS